MPPKPRDTWQRALDIQMQLWARARSPLGRDHLASQYRSYDGAESFAAADLAMNTRLLLEAEERQLLYGDPIFVTAEMCDVIEGAAPSFTPEGLTESDVLSTFGFLLYERPLQYESSDDPGDMAALSWGRFLDPDHDPFWHISFYTDRLADGSQAPSYYPDSSTFLEEGPNHIGQEGGRARLRLLEVTLRLMQQRLAANTLERPDKSGRRDAARYQFDSRDILVIRLRRPPSPKATDEPATVEWSHRWLVGGHWRNHWWPKLGVHRQTFIGPHVKGPEDKPLVVKRRAYILDR